MDDVGGFSCNCRLGFEGERCETDVDECASQPCKNGAFCKDYVNSFVCECPPGFNGILCENNIQECTERLVYMLRLLLLNTWMTSFDLFCDFFLIYV